MTLISNRVVFEKLLEYNDKEGRFSMVIGRVEGVDITLLNVYAPP